MGELWSPVTPRVVDDHETTAGRLGTAEKGAVGGRVYGSVVFRVGAVLEIMAPVRVATRSSHIQRSQEGASVAAISSIGIVIVVGTIDHAQLTIEKLVKLVGRE